MSTNESRLWITIYRPRYTILGSRKQYCPIRKTDEECSDLIKDARLMPTDTMCAHFNNKEALVSDLREAELWDIEDVNKAADHHTACQFFAMKEMFKTVGLCNPGPLFGRHRFNTLLIVYLSTSTGHAHNVIVLYHRTLYTFSNTVSTNHKSWLREPYKTAELVLCPYNYIFDPNIREALDINIKDAAVIIDEGHNIEDVCREGGSLELDCKQLQEMVSEVQVVVGYDRAAQPALELTQRLDRWIQTQVGEATYARDRCKVWRGKAVQVDIRLTLG